MGKRFRQYLKLTPAEYIRQRRLECAKELLRSGELTVAQISEARQFYDCSYFCHIFRQATGTNSGAWRPSPATMDAERYRRVAVWSRPLLNPPLVHTGWAKPPPAAMPP